MTRWPPMLAMLLAIGAASRTATAQASATEAEQLFKEGVQAADKGDYATACAKFGKSLELVTRASTLLNLAVCEAEQGRLASALKRYEAGVPLLAPGDERLAEAARSMEALQRRVPRLIVKLSADTPGTARVLVDGSEVERNKLDSLPLDPGEHTVLLAIPGHQDNSSRVMLREGQRTEVTLEPGPSIESDKPQPTTVIQVEPDHTLRTVGLVVGGIGVLGAIGAAVTGGLLLKNDSSIEENCPNKLCNAEGQSKIDESETLIIVNYVSWGVAIAGIGTGVALIVADAVMTKDEPVSAGAAILPGGGYATLIGRF